MYDPQIAYAHLTDLLVKTGLRHDIHKFPSGAIMVDIWHGKRFYVVQIEEDLTGFSEIADDPSFCTEPDIKYFSNSALETKLHSLFK